jgi:hypothetical protein
MYSDHVWIKLCHISGEIQVRCLECACFLEQAEAHCLRPVKTHRERLAEALQTVMEDFLVTRDGTVYYKGETDGSRI